MTATSKAADLAAMDDVKSADALWSACDGDLNQIAALGKDTIFFLRHQSGPLYLYYEIISPRFLRQHGDALAVKGIDDQDVVVDSLDEVLWRLRSLCGLRNTMGTNTGRRWPRRWAHPAEPTAKLVSEKFKFDIQTVTYDELGKLIQAARQDQAAVALGQEAGGRLSADAGDQAGNRGPVCRKLHAPGSGLPQAHAGGRLPHADHQRLHGHDHAGCRDYGVPDPQHAQRRWLLCLLRIGFIVIPAGVLMGNISGQPTFLNDPTYPHDGVITLAHCTARGGWTATPNR